MQQGSIQSAKDNGRLKLSETDASGCLSLGLGKPVVNEGALLQVELPYQSEGGARPHFCV